MSTRRGNQYDRYKKLYKGYPTTTGAPDPTVGSINKNRADGLFLSLRQKKPWDKCSQHEKQGIVDQLIDVKKAAIRQEKRQRKKAAQEAEAREAEAREAKAREAKAREAGKDGGTNANLDALTGLVTEAYQALQLRQTANEEAHDNLVKSTKNFVKSTSEAITDLANRTDERFIQQDKKIGHLDRRQTITEEELNALRANQMISLGAPALANRILPQIHKAATIGKPINFDMVSFLKYQPTLSRFLGGYLDRLSINPKLKLYFFLLTNQHLHKDHHAALINKFNCSWLPIICAIEGEEEPTNYICKPADNLEGIDGTILQFGIKTFASFDSIGMSWEKANGIAAHILVSAAEKTLKDEWSTIPLTKPSRIRALEPEPIGTLEVVYKGIHIAASSSKEVKVYINEEDTLDGTDFEPIKATIKEEKQRRKALNQERVDEEKRFFAKFVESLADGGASVDSVMENLEAMKVYKIYPEYDAETLPPPREVITSFFKEKGNSQVIGEVKHAAYDSFYGEVDGVY